MNVNMNSTIADALFGSKNTVGAGSFLSSSSLGDLSLMRSGVYTKMLRSYYEKTGDAESTSKTSSKTKEKNSYETELTNKVSELKNSTGNNALSSVKSTAQALQSAADSLSDMDFEKSSRDDLYAGVKKMLDSYNSVLESVEKTDNISITQSTSWMTSDVKAHEKQLAKVGISIDADQQFSIDKEAFAKADLTDIQSLFKGSMGYASKLSKRAGGLYNLASNQIAFNSGKTLYSSSGVLG